MCLSTKPLTSFRLYKNLHVLGKHLNIRLFANVYSKQFVNIYFWPKFFEHPIHIQGGLKVVLQFRLSIICAHGEQN